MRPGDLVYCWFGSFFDITGIIVERLTDRDTERYSVFVNGRLVEIDRLNLRLAETTTNNIKYK